MHCHFPISELIAVYLVGLMLSSADVAFIRTPAPDEKSKLFGFGGGAARVVHRQETGLGLGLRAHPSEDRANSSPTVKMFKVLE